MCLHNNYKPRCLWGLHLTAFTPHIPAGMVRLSPLTFPVGGAAIPTEGWEHGGHSANATQVSRGRAPAGPLKHSLAFVSRFYFHPGNPQPRGPRDCRSPGPPPLLPAQIHSQLTNWRA